MPDPKRDSRRSSRSGTSDAHRHEKRERSRSYQEARRGSLKPSEQERPRLKSRTHSAPLVQLRQQQQDHVEKSWDQDGESEDDESPLPSGSRSPAYFDTLTRTTSGDALSRMPSGPPVSPRSSEINIVVLGAPGVGKSTFIQLALDLPTPASLGARKIPLNGSSCLVRLLELPFDEVDIDEDDIISWPDRIEQRKMPRVDGAMTLYDVSDRKSFEQVPEVLTAIRKASIPSMLISSKCDYPPAKRDLDPVQIEETAKSRIGNIETLQTTFAGSDAHKRGVSVLLKAIQANKHDQVSETSAAHRRTKSSAYSKPPLRLQSQSRASADSVGMTPIDLAHTRHDSSMMTNSPKRSSEPIAPNEMHHSFLLDESTESDTEESASKEPDARSETPSDERGYTFDNLVDRLLALPKSKADSRFGAIFLAEYRNFAPPGRLLEAIVCRFEALDSTDTPFMMKTVSQLRYLSVIEQWIGAYPGDFAHPTTLRRMRTFIVKIAETRIFSAAANEMTFDLDAVHEDDDTNWAYSDRDCERRDTTDTTASWESRASTLLDDPDFTFPDRMAARAEQLQLPRRHPSRRQQHRRTPSRRDQGSGAPGRGEGLGQTRDPHGAVEILLRVQTGVGELERRADPVYPAAETRSRGRHGREQDCDSSSTSAALKLRLLQAQGAGRGSGSSSGDERSVHDHYEGKVGRPRPCDDFMIYHFLSKGVNGTNLGAMGRKVPCAWKSWKSWKGLVTINPCFAAYDL
ncbi:hypothetical protein M8818_001433 [Zalaria obscura]|uniref:Uncharacterized protein n=1 Tax=Zalaria obscura TaxID=2024903 RepID=A0ACC3SKQ2_9PEZI